jgi:hypothetical protein
VQEIGDESLVYDRDSDVAHCLSAVAAGVWRGCDGERDQPALARFAGVSEELVADALDELRAEGLLIDGRSMPRRDESGVSRRRALGRMAKYGAGVAAIPLIVSAVVASPASAASVGLGAPCAGTTGNTCLAPLGCSVLGLGLGNGVCGGLLALCTRNGECVSNCCTAGVCANTVLGACL